VAQFEIKKRAETARMPQLILKFLADEWVKLLLLTHARHGKGSEAWKSGLETMDLLIWSVKQKQSTEERRRLAALLPGLLKRMNAGLQAIATEAERRKQFFTRLMRLHTKVIGTGSLQSSAPVAAGEANVSQTEQVRALSGDAGDSSRHDLASQAVSPSPSASHGAASGPSQPLRSDVDEDAEPATSAPDFSNVKIKNPFGEGEIEVEEISLPDLPGFPELSAELGETAAKPNPSADDDQYGQLVTNLKAGDWVEFRDDDRRTQAKLSYVSPVKGTYLFVNRHGVKVGEYSLYQLTRDFRTGRAIALESVPLFDRAMRSLVGVLKKSAK
jgi:hypothetical protein